jgi:hypothetical protein
MAVSMIDGGGTGGMEGTIAKSGPFVITIWKYIATTRLIAVTPTQIIAPIVKENLAIFKSTAIHAVSLFMAGIFLSVSTSDM